MLIDPLALLLLGEAGILAAILAVMLALKLRKLKARKGEKRADLWLIMQQQIAEQLKSLKQSHKDNAQTTIEGRIIADLQATSLRFLTAVSGDLKIPKNDTTRLWESIYRNVEAAVRDALQGKRDAMLEAESLHAKTKKSDELREENAQLKDLVYKQGAKIADLFGYKDLYLETRKRLDAILKANADLSKKVLAFSEGAQGIEAVKHLAEEFEKTNKELEMYVTVLEKENDRLTTDYVEWQKDLKKMDEQQAREIRAAEADSVLIAKEHEGQAVRIKELEKTLEDRMNELASLQKKLEGLEKEYLVLYEKHGA